MADTVSSILGAAGGVSGIGAGVGDVICALKGTCQPEHLTVVNQQQPAGANNTIFLLVGGGLVVVVLLIVLLKQ